MKLRSRKLCTFRTNFFLFLSRPLVTNLWLVPRGLKMALEGVRVLNLVLFDNAVIRRGRSQQRLENICLLLLGFHQGMIQNVIARAADACRSSRLSLFRSFLGRDCPRPNSTNEFVVKKRFQINRHCNARRMWRRGNTYYQCD